ncbi:HNH endonuclease [Archangium sp.]|uniref:HNH endonuclease n=1 Tax=Archangium sp. TaxID=1872627 RepID=UPI002ED8369F
MAALLVLAGCATHVPRGPLMPGLRHRSQAPTPYESLKVQRASAQALPVSAPEGLLAHGEDKAQLVASRNNAPEDEDGDEGPASRGHRPAHEEGEPLGGWSEGTAGWRDGIGDSRPQAVPMSLDYFQGFLVQVGVPTDDLPVDGRTLSPEQALRLLPPLLSTPVTLGNFAQRRMAAHLLLEVAMGGVTVSRDELHARMRRFLRLLVLRPDGYLVRPTTGEAKQRAGEMRVAEDGTLRAGHFEVGPFYAIEGGRLWPVDSALEVSTGVPPLGAYLPDDGVLRPAVEGAGLALVDTVQGLYQLAFHPVETLEGLAQLPDAVRVLVHNAPEYWEAFRYKPSGEQVRAVSRLTTSVVLVVGTSGAGAAKAASWGGTLGHLAVPVFALTREGALTLQVVAVPAGRLVAATGQVLSATYVLHMANTGTQGPGGSAPPTEQGAKTGVRGGPGSGKRFPEGVKAAAEQESGGRCVFCDRQTTREPGPDQRNTDHAVPKSRGGNNTLDNAQNTCRTCNLDKASKTTEEFLEGR